MMQKFPKTEAAIRHLAKVDADFKELVRRVGKPKLMIDPSETIFDACATSIIYQQIHGKAAASILKKLKRHLGISESRALTAQRLLSAKAEGLRSCGVSENKLKALLDLSLKDQAGLIPTRKQAEKLTDEEMIECLTEVRGIGPWTVQMILIFTLGRPNVWPSLDYGVRKGYAALKGKRKMPDAVSFQKHAKMYAPFCSLAAWYCWRVLEQEYYSKKVKRVKSD